MGFNKGDKVRFQHFQPEANDPRNGEVGTITGDTGESSVFSSFVVVQWDDGINGLAMLSELTLVEAVTV